MKIALIGFGLEAKSAYDYFKSIDQNITFEIYDENSKSKIELPNGVKFFGDFHDFSKIQADLIVRTPAVNPSRLPKSAKITSVTNLFFEKCPASIIGVTGSKGKGTVSSFIAEILRAAGLKVYLVGNIGLPALNELSKIQKDDAVIYELSSFQLWDAQKSPHIAILNNLEVDHLDVHDGFEDYVAAKMNIAKNQTENDFFIFNAENPIVLKNVENLKNQLKAELQPFRDYNLAHIQENHFLWGDEVLFETNILKIPGEHNQKNACAAMIATFDFLREKGFENEEIFDFWREGLSKFAGLPHRLKFVREFEGVRFYDDSIATTPGSAIAALNSFEKPKILILGGSNKGADLSGLIEKIAKMPEQELRKVILMGAESEKLAQKLISSGFERFINLGAKTNMQEVVKTAFKNAKSGDVVILSPAHASFDMFKSYIDRGEQFVENANLL
ncbi:MAG: UDP-N-acetylmuramoyl-L-alanine--D-glutamate ligase [Candidatus Saccharimonas sp.]|nr:MAG: UDP-N-acetylmuramoyl-L-alanine--D-glutamate ligase [Candidatus Saccharimonas sp.]